MNQLATMARRATFHEARRHFESGGSVLVSEEGHQPFVVVTADSTTHSKDTTTWDELASTVRMWRNRYPHQRFYIVEPAQNAESERVREAIVELRRDAAAAQNADSVACIRCGEQYDEDKGDGYCGLCPACADAWDEIADEDGTPDLETWADLGVPEEQNDGSSQETV